MTKIMDEKRMAEKRTYNSGDHNNKSVLDEVQ